LTAGSRFLRKRRFCLGNPPPQGQAVIFARLDRLSFMTRSLPVLAASLACALGACQGEAPAPATSAVDAAADAKRSTVDARKPPAPDAAIADVGVEVDQGPASAADPPWPRTCEASPPANHAGAPTLALALRPTLGAGAVELGVATAALGRRITLAELRFFVTHVVLRAADGKGVLADLLDEQGRMRPYGVQLVDLESEDTLTLRLRAPAGEYTGLSLGIGLSPACNVGNPATREFPLNAGGGMSWAWIGGYIFVRLGGGATDDKGASEGFMAHAGMFPPDAGAVRLVVPGRVVVGGANAALPLHARLDDLIEVSFGSNDIEGGMKLLARLPSARFLSLGEGP
jgi:hypothetical protein